MSHPHTSSPQKKLPSGWSRPKPEIISDPTWWPAALALGSTIIAWGFVTSFIVLVIGLVTFTVSLAGWIGDIRHEQRKN